MSLEYRFENRSTVQVRPSQPEKRNPCWYVVIALGLVLFGLVGWMFFSGYFTPMDSTGAHALTLRGKMNEQTRLIKQQTEQLQSLEDQLAATKRDKQVQEVANHELNKKLALAESNLAVEREKLVLYEGILSPEGLEPGLHIQHFALKPRLVDDNGQKVAANTRYHYHVVLANIRAGEASVGGTYTITLTGKRNGETVNLTQKDITPNGTEPNAQFMVKHYQSLEGNLLIPKDFIPQSVKLTVTPDGGETPDRLTQHYNWDTLTNPVNDSNASK